MAGPKFIWLSASLIRIHVSETGRFKSDCRLIQIFEESWREEKVIELANKAEFEEKGIKVMKL
jgi:hypothetical protein